MSTRCGLEGSSQGMTPSNAKQLFSDSLSRRVLDTVLRNVSRNEKFGGGASGAHDDDACSIRTIVPYGVEEVQVSRRVNTKSNMRSSTKRKRSGRRGGDEESNSLDLGRLSQ